MQVGLYFQTTNWLSSHRKKQNNKTKTHVVNCHNCMYIIIWMSEKTYIQ